MKNQYDIDDKVMNLAHQLNDVVGYATTAWEKPEKIPPLENTIITLFQQIIECCVFIREYTGHRFASKSYDAHFMKSFSNLTRMFRADNVQRQ